MQRLSTALTLAAIRAYRRWLSPHTPVCTQDPSCSAYAAAMVTEHGARVGLHLALSRIRSEV